eukprot:m.34274 g.34274  ORF g.34274 m.34274 type:complete len:75 (+) comp14288_c0_seq1:64-288(+)
MRQSCCITLMDCASCYSLPYGDVVVGYQRTSQEEPPASDNLPNVISDQSLQNPSPAVLTEPRAGAVRFRSKRAG